MKISIPLSPLEVCENVNIENILTRFLCSSVSNIIKFLYESKI